MILRRWKSGDVFYPTGMTGKKKVAKYFKDEKMSSLDKKKEMVHFLFKKFLFFFFLPRRSRPRCAFGFRRPKPTTNSLF